MTPTEIAQEINNNQSDISGRVSTQLSHLWTKFKTTNDSRKINEITDQGVMETVREADLEARAYLIKISKLMREELEKIEKVLSSSGATSNTPEQKQAKLDIS